MRSCTTQEISKGDKRNRTHSLHISIEIGAQLVLTHCKGVNVQFVTWKCYLPICTLRYVGNLINTTVFHPWIYSVRHEFTRLRRRQLSSCMSGSRPESILTWPQSIWLSIRSGIFSTRIAFPFEFAERGGSYIFRFTKLVCACNASLLSNCHHSRW